MRVHVRVRVCMCMCACVCAFVLQVGDFGMSRNLADDTYYQSHGGKIPFRWTAPEVWHYHRIIQKYCHEVVELYTRL